jgi:hypothetical protein
MPDSNDAENRSPFNVGALATWSWLSRNDESIRRNPGWACRDVGLPGTLALEKSPFHQRRNSRSSR